jgi:hypothetical protein
LPVGVWVAELPTWSTASTRQLNEIAVKDRKTLRGLTQFLRASVVARSQTIEGERVRGAISQQADVCDNQCATARKLLILKTERCPSG